VRFTLLAELLRSCTVASVVGRVRLVETPGHRVALLVRLRPEGGVGFILGVSQELDHHPDPGGEQ
jgi:hypothetical protein